MLEPLFFKLKNSFAQDCDILYNKICTLLGFYKLTFF